VLLDRRFIGEAIQTVLHPPGPIDSGGDATLKDGSPGFAGREGFMAEKKKAAEGGAVSGKTKADKTVTKEVVSVPEAASEPALRMKSTKIPKLAKKNKSRLPRREKKAQQKADQAG
jgi:hypothetical protein